jgi:hypothetical protein
MLVAIKSIHKLTMETTIQNEIQAILGNDWELNTEFGNREKPSWVVCQFKCRLTGRKVQVDPENKRTLKREFTDYEFLEYKIEKSSVVGNCESFLQVQYKC